MGSALARALSHEHEVSCTFQADYTPIKGVEYHPVGRLDDKDAGRAFIQTVAPQIVICCTGSNDLIRAEDDRLARETLISHTGVPTTLNTASDSQKAKFIYISSDYIFSGTDGNFAEGDVTVPHSQLGKAKLSSENYIRGRSLNHLIIRCAPLIGRGPLDHPSWIDRIRENLTLGNPVTLPTKLIQNPVHISLLISVVKEAIDQELKNKTFHVGGLSKVSSFEFAQIFSQFLKLDTTLIRAPETESHSTADYSLNISQTLATLHLKPLHLEESLELTKRQ